MFSHHFQLLSNHAMRNHNKSFIVLDYQCALLCMWNCTGYCLRRAAELSVCFIVHVELYRLLPASGSRTWRENEFHLVSDIGRYLTSSRTIMVQSLEALWRTRTWLV